MIIRVSIILGILFLTSPTAWADGIPVEPGMWEMSATMNMPMQPQPRVTTTTECIKESEISMDDMDVGEMDPNCQFEMAQIDGNTMKWSFDCPVEGGTSHGEWEATSSGDSVTGKGVVTMSFQGRSMEMTMSWEGKRVGDCQ
jgi:hypothetical protein